MFKFFLAIVFLSFALAAPPAQAQINFDIPETETPGGGGGDATPGEEFYCANCCSNAISDPSCCRDCNCQCMGLPSCVSYGYSAMSSAGIPETVNIAVRVSMGMAFERMSSTARGKMLASVLEANAKRVGEIHANNPELAKRIAMSLVKYWPYDMWSNTGEKAHKVSPEAMQELRSLLSEVAKADREMGGSAVADTIRKDVLPHLTKELIGKPYHQAFACFIGSERCS